MNAKCNRVKFSRAGPASAPAGTDAAVHLRGPVVQRRRRVASGRLHALPLRQGHDKLRDRVGLRHVGRSDGAQVRVAERRPRLPIRRLSRDRLRHAVLRSARPVLSRLRW